MANVTLSQGWRKARKQHMCDWCGEAIKKGEEYNYANTVDQTSGEWWTTRFHGECSDAWKQTMKNNPDCTEQLCEELLSWGPFERGFEG